MIKIVKKGKITIRITLQSTYKHQVTSISRSLAKETEYIEELVETSTGRVLVAHSGDRSKPVRIPLQDVDL